MCLTYVLYGVGEMASTDVDACKAQRPALFSMPKPNFVCWAPDGRNANDSVIGVSQDEVWLSALDPDPNCASMHGSSDEDANRNHGVANSWKG